MHLGRSTIDTEVGCDVLNADGTALSQNVQSWTMTQEQAETAADSWRADEAKVCTRSFPR